MALLREQRSGDDCIGRARPGHASKGAAARHVWFMAPDELRCACAAPSPVGVSPSCAHALGPGHARAPLRHRRAAAYSTQGCPAGATTKSGVGPPHWPCRPGCEAIESPPGASPDGIGTASRRFCCERSVRGRFRHGIRTALARVGRQSGDTSLGRSQPKCSPSLASSPFHALAVGRLPEQTTHRPGVGRRPGASLVSAHCLWRCAESVSPLPRAGWWLAAACRLSSRFLARRSRRQTTPTAALPSTSTVRHPPQW